MPVLVGNTSAVTRFEKSGAAGTYLRKNQVWTHLYQRKRSVWFKHLIDDIRLQPALVRRKIRQVQVYNEMATAFLRLQQEVFMSFVLHVTLLVINI